MSTYFQVSLYLNCTPFGLIQFVHQFLTSPLNFIEFGKPFRVHTLKPASHDFGNS